MGLEAVMICIDNSEFSRNGDYAPSRFDQQTETANLLGGTKTGTGEFVDICGWEFKSMDRIPI